MKQHINLIKAVVLFSIFMILLGMANYYLAYHDPKLRPRIDKIYMKENPADVVIVGNSHASFSFNPDFFANVLDIEPVLLATPGQDLYQTYLLLEEIVRERDVKVVILETFSLLQPPPGPIENESDQRYAKYRGMFNEIPLSIAKIRIAATVAKPTLVPGLLCPIINSHNNWKDWGRIQDNLDYSFDPENYGNRRTNFETLSLEEALLYQESEYELEYHFADEQMMWLQKVINLVRSNGGDVVVVMAPLYQSFLEHTNYESESKRIQEAAHDLNLQFLDMNELTEMGTDPINFQNESAYKNGRINANQHLSYIGNYKASAFMLPVLAEMLGIMNYDEEKNEFELDSYLNGLDEDGKIIIVSYFNKDNKQLVPDIDALSSLGVATESLENNSNGFFVFDYSEKESSGTSFFSDELFAVDFGKHEEFKKMELPLSLFISSKHGSSVTMSINGERYNVGEDGLMIITYDPGKQQVVDRAFFKLTDSTYRCVW